MSFDITDTLAPNSDQLDAVELAGGPRTFTIERVERGNAEQPVNVWLQGFPRPWRPAKSMRRVLAACWGTDASVYPGRRVTLYFDPEVTFGKEKPGGTRIKAVSHIDATKKVPLLVARGRSAMFTVEPLPDEPARPSITAGQVQQSTDRAELRGWWRSASPEVQSLIQARVAELDEAGAA